MEVRTLIKRGGDHHTNCEDDLFAFNDGSTYIGAVFDGCSSGVKSHFASALYGKILKKFYNATSYAFPKLDLESIGRLFYYDLFYALKQTLSIYQLNDMELLSTMIFTVIRDRQAYIMVSGDGCIKVDDELYELESPGNAPNYLVYYLDDFSESKRVLKEYSFAFDKSLSICSDGIFSFTNQDREDMSYKVIDSLLNDTSFLKSEAMLARKYNLLLKEGYTHYDDLSIVRFIL